MNTIYSGAPYQELPNLSCISVKMPLYSLLCEKECQGRKEKDEEPSIDSVDCMSKRTISSNVLHRTICHSLSTCSLENLYILPFPGLMTLATHLGTPPPPRVVMAFKNMHPSPFHYRGGVLSQCPNGGQDVIRRRVRFSPK